MLIALLEKGICGEGCGNLGRALDILGRHGEPYLAECNYGDILAFCYVEENRPYDFLVIRINTSRMSGDHEAEYYKVSTITRDLIETKVEEYRDLICTLWEKLRPLTLIITRNPYIDIYTIGIPMSPSDVIDIAWRKEGAEIAARLKVESLDQLERPFIEVSYIEKPPEICK